MGNATGQRADAFHALGAEKLRLHFFLLGDVAVDGKNGLRLAGFIAQQSPAALDDDFTAVFARLDYFARPFGIGLQLFRSFAVTGGIFYHRFGHVTPDGLRRRPPVNAFRTFAPEADNVVQIAHDDGVAGAIQQFSLFVQTLFCLFALTDVLDL